MPMGRPSKYTETMGAEIIDLLDQGYSITAAAGIIGVSRETVYAWEREKPEFSDALKIGRAKRTAFWEKKLATEEGGRNAANIFALKNACREEWRADTHLSVTSPDGSMSPKGLDLSRLDTATLAKLADAIGDDGGADVD